MIEEETTDVWTRWATLVPTERMTRARKGLGPYRGLGTDGTCRRHMIVWLVRGPGDVGAVEIARLLALTHPPVVKALAVMRSWPKDGAAEWAKHAVTLVEALLADAPQKATCGPLVGPAYREVRVRRWPWSRSGARGNSGGGSRGSGGGKRSRT